MSAFSCGAFKLMSRGLIRRRRRMCTWPKNKGGIRYGGQQNSLDSVWLSPVYFAHSNFALIFSESCFAAAAAATAAG